jgi:hypothetical protein
LFRLLMNCEASQMSSTTHHEQTPTSSGTNTPTPAPSSYLPSVISHAVTGLLRRMSTDPGTERSQPSTRQSSLSESNSYSKKSLNGVYTPPHRTASPFQPPPLYPLSLHGYRTSTAPSAQLLSRQLAEEIRLLVPPRLQLCEEWKLVYSLEEDGVSLSTLYKKCSDLRGLRNGYVLVVRDGDGGVRLGPGHRSSYSSD